MIQNQQPDIIGAFLNVARHTLGLNVFSPDAEKDIEAKLRHEFGGQEVYIKKTGADEIEARALAIRAEYNMCNRRELQLKYSVGRAQFYKILKGG
ncbi:MAG: Mor transcription activator family protein [Telluria sp.]